jgi:hypothetical protein
MEQTHTQTGSDGSFDMIVLPGRGVLGAWDSEHPLGPAKELKSDPILLRETVPDLRGRETAFKVIEVPENQKETSIDFQVRLVQQNEEKPTRNAGDEPSLPDSKNDRNHQD